MNAREMDFRDVEKVDRANKLYRDRRHRDDKAEFAHILTMSEVRRSIEGVCRCGAALNEESFCEYCDY